MKLKSLCILATSCFALATPLSAQDYDLWKNVSDWKIFLNEATNGCFMELGTDDDFVVHIGTTEEMFKGTESDRTYFLGLFAPVESGFAEAQTEEVTFKTGPDAFVGEAYSMQRGDHHGWSIQVNNSKLLDDLHNRRALEVTSASGGTVMIDLDEMKTGEAFDQLTECQIQH